MEELKEYCQEKENIYIYCGKAERYYRININTGEMFGQTGRKLLFLQMQTLTKKKKLLILYVIKIGMKF